MKTSLFFPHLSRPTLSLLLGLIAFLTLSMGCQRSLDPEDSCHFFQNPDTQRVSWKKNLPVKLHVHSSVPTEAYQSLREAMDEYAELSKAVGKPLFEIVTYGATGPLEPSRDGNSVIYWMSDWESERLAEQGRTTIYWSGNSIYEVDMRINASELSGFTFHFTEQADALSGVDLKSLFVHELGHVLGLSHSETPGSIMHTHLQDGVVRDTLSSEDMKNLRCEYPSES